MRSTRNRAFKVDPTRMWFAGKNRNQPDPNETAGRIKSAYPTPCWTRCWLEFLRTPFVSMLIKSNLGMDAKVFWPILLVISVLAKNVKSTVLEFAVWRTTSAEWQCKITRKPESPFLHKYFLKEFCAC